MAVNVEDLGQLCRDKRNKLGGEDTVVDHLVVRHMLEPQMDVERSWGNDGVDIGDHDLGERGAR